MPVQSSAGGGRASRSGARALRPSASGPAKQQTSRQILSSPRALREWTVGGHRLQADNDAKLLGGVRQKVAVGLHDRPRLALVPCERPPEDHADRMGLEKEAGDDAEIAAAAFQRPQEVGIVGLARGDERAVREHDVGFDQVVDRQAELPGQISGPSAEGKSGDARRRHDAERNGEAESMRRVVDVARRAAGFDADCAAARVDANAFHRRKIDRQPVVDAAESRTVVAAAADRDWHRLLAAEVHGGDDVGRVGAPGDQQGSLVNHAVVELPRLLVARVAPRHQRAVKALAESGDCLAVHDNPPRR